MDITKLPGIRTVVHVAQYFWQEVQANIRENGDASAAIFVTVLVYGVSFWLLGRALVWLSQFILKGGARDRFRRFVRLTSSLTSLLLILETIVMMYPEYQGLAPAFLSSYLYILIAYFLAVLSSYLVRRNERAGQVDSSIALLLTNAFRVLWAFVALYLVFQEFDVNIIPLLGGLGIIGVALGFAAQDLLGNLVSGLALLLDRPFHIGDWIQVGSHEGQVLGISARTTRIRKRDHSVVNIPNKEVAGGTVLNLTNDGPLRLSVTVGISYNADLEQAKSVLNDVLHGHSDIVFDEDYPSGVMVGKLGRSTVDVSLVFWISKEGVATYPALLMRLNEEIKAALDKAGIDMPYPNLQLHIESAKGLGYVANPPERSVPPREVGAHRTLSQSEQPRLDRPTPAVRQATGPVTAAATKETSEETT